MPRPRHPAGFTIIEAIFVFAAAGAICFLVLVARMPVRKGCGRLMKDSSQLRGVTMGFDLWAQSNQDRYPLPSLLDADNATVAEIGPAKDTTANICSILIFNSYFPPELLVSPQEPNMNIVRFEGYELENPAAAIDPAHALWDPALRADFTGPTPGNISYAHTLPRGGPGPFDYKTEHWGATYIANQALIGNRGPQITGITYPKNGPPVPTFAPVPGTGTGESLTYLIHGSRTKWEGNIGYTDNHVNFETSVTPEALTYMAPDGKARPDCLFFDEPDAANGANNFLSIYTVAGPQKGDFKSIWD